MVAFVTFQRRHSTEKWDLAIDGAEVIERAGPRRKRSSEHFDSEAEARGHGRRRVLAMLEKGFELFGAPARFSSSLTPSERELVAADERLQAGDRRGVLTILLARLTTEPHEAWYSTWCELTLALRELFGPSGENAQRVLNEDGRLGDLSVNLESPEQFAELRLEAEASRFLASLSVASATLELQPAIDQLAAIAPGSLRRLSLATQARSLGNLNALLVALPGLQSLRLEAMNFEVGTAPHRLTELVARPHKHFFSNALKSLRSPVFANLDTLGLEVTVPDDVFDWLFSGDLFPSLTTLRLQLSFPDAEARLLPYLTKKAKLFSRLGRFDLLGTFNYELLGDLRHHAAVLKPIRHVGVFASMEGLQFGRLKSLVPGLERLPASSL